METKEKEKIQHELKNLPAIYGNETKKQEAINAVFSLFRDKASMIDKIFLPSSLLSIDERKSLLIEITKPLPEKLLNLGGGYHGMRWLAVQAKEGKTAASAKCTIGVLRESNQPDVLREGVDVLIDYRAYCPGKSQFFAPASMLYRTADGCFLPEWFVQKKLREIRDNSPRRARFDRIPAGPAVWPGLTAWLEQLFQILPSQEEIEAAQEENEKKNEERLRQAEQEKIEEERRRKEREEEQKKEAARAEKNAAALLARRAGQKQIHNVDVLISGTEKVKNMN